MAWSGARIRVRRLVGALTIAILLGAAVAVGGGPGWPGAAAPPDPGTPVSTHDPERTDGPTPAPARTIAPTPASPTAVPPSGSGGGTVDRPGIAITARPVADGSFLVTEAVTLPTSTTEAVLRPPLVADAGAGFERLRPVAIDVEVRAGGQLLTVPGAPVRDEVTVRWAEPTSELRLRYRLGWVSVASPHARPGRSLATFGPLVAGMPADLPVTVVVRGPTLLSLTCPQLPLARSACGVGAAPTLTTSRPLPFDRSRVLVQYDRPKPRR